MIERFLNETFDWEFEVLDDSIAMNIHFQSSRKELCYSTLHNKNLTTEVNQVRLCPHGLSKQSNISLTPPKAMQYNFEYLQFSSLSLDLLLKFVCFFS